MPIKITLPVDVTGNKTKVILQYLLLNTEGEVYDGSILVKYVDPNDADLPPGGTIQQKKIKTETPMPLSLTLGRYINPPSLVYVNPAPETDLTTLKLVGPYISGRTVSQLGVSANPDLKKLTEGIFLKIVEVLQANGELPL